jgi:hypothetical protein
MHTFVLQLFELRLEDVLITVVNVDSDWFCNTEIEHNSLLV